MIELENRAGVRTFSLADRSRRLVVYEDHRTLLFVLFHAMQKRLLDRAAPPTLLRLDLHDDGAEPLCGLDRLAELRRSSPTERDFLSFLEWELSPLDDDWVKAGMELGLIGDVVLSGAEIEPNFEGSRNDYTDHLGGSHRLWSIGHLWEALGNRGDLGGLRED